MKPELNTQLPAEPVSLPPEFFPLLLGDQLGRDFFNRLEGEADWVFPSCGKSRSYRWLRLDRLPIPPAKWENYNLLEKWQSVLSAVHTMKSSFALVLLRQRGRTQVYLGACREGEAGDGPARRLSRAARVHMQGVSLEPPVGGDPVRRCLSALPYTGIVTGIPSFRKQNEDQPDLLQTLDKLAYGVTDENGLEEDYALVVLAEPAEDGVIAALTNTLLKLQGEVHSAVSRNVSFNQGSSTSASTSLSASLGAGKVIEGLCGAAGSVAGQFLVPGLGGIAGGALGAAAGKKAGSVLDALGLSFSMSQSRSRSQSSGSSVSHEERDGVAKYCEDLIAKHIQRLQNGRSLGFWNTGVYVLGESRDAVEAVLGMLRSIYAGRDTYLEPIRAFNTGRNEHIFSYIENLCLLPLPGSPEDRRQLGETMGLESGWHVFGPLYESFSTPLTTQELSIATSLPRQDVPGLRFVRNAVKMTANPPALPEGCRSIRLGEVCDLGIPTGLDYELDLDSLVRHVLNDGLTGYGKSTTTHRILDGVSRHGVPWLVIEPVKTDYVEWAMRHNKSCPPEERIAIYMPGYSRFYGQDLERMCFNPFQPCAPKGAPLNLQGHLDALASLLTASVSMGEVLPLLMKEALQNLANDALGVDPATGRWLANGNQVDPEQIQGWPKFSQLLDAVQALMRARGYAAENHQNLTAAMETRIKSLLLGWKQDFFDAPASTPGEDLFGRKVIINLIGIESDEDKAFFMSLILRALTEYRSASYYYDPDYYESLQHGDRLTHLTVVEEAHRLIAAPAGGYGGAADPQAATAAMFSSLLREVRKWGEGLMIVDQQPSQLIPDALKNTNLKIIHKMPAEDDRRAVGACMGLNEEQTALIAALGVGEVILSSEHDDAALWVKVYRDEP